MHKKILNSLKLIIIYLLLAGCDQQFDSSFAPVKSNPLPGNTSGALLLEPAFDPIASLPVYKTGAVAFTIVGKYAFVGTGYAVNPITGVLKPSKDFWRYDPSADTWTQVADLGGEPRVFASAFSIGTKGYVGTGGNISKLKDFWEYDYFTNSWTQKANFPGEPRQGATGFSIGQTGYFGTGQIDGVTTHAKDFWKYDPTIDQWSKLAELPGKGRIFAGNFVIDDAAYVGAGYKENVPLQDFWRYNPTTDIWQQVASLGEDALPGQSGFFSVNKMGYAGGNQQLWRYNPGLDEWIKIAGFPETMHNGVGFSLLGEYGYIGTGSHPNNPFGGNLFYRYSL